MTVPRPRRARAVPKTAAPALLLVLAVAAALFANGHGAQADPVPGVDEFPRTAFVARNDVPFDSLALGPIAGALGGIVVITSPTSLSAAAENALTNFNPDLVIIAGGTAAISQSVENAIAAAGAWDVDRKAGTGRDQTAAELATVLTDLSMGRPGLTGQGQVIGDLRVGGLAHSDTLKVEGSAEARGIATAGVSVGSVGNLRSWFNQSGAEPTVTKLPGDGQYRIEIPGLEIESDNHVVSAVSDVATWTTVSHNAGGLVVGTREHTGTLTDGHFYLTVWEASPSG